MHKNKKPKRLELPRADFAWIAMLSISGLSIDEIGFVMQARPEMVELVLEHHNITPDTYALPPALKEELIEESTARDFAQYRGEKY